MHQLQGATAVSTEITGSNELPQLDDLQQRPHNLPYLGAEWETFTSRRIIKLRDYWIRKVPEVAAFFHAEGRAEGYTEGFSAARREARELNHITQHPNVPDTLIKALQHGIDLDNPLSGATVDIEHLMVHVAVSSTGTGIPEPASQTVWDQLRATVRDIAACPYVADVIAPLPPEIAAIAWTADGHTVSVTPPRKEPRRLRGLSALLLIPLARLGHMTALPTAGLAATASTAAVLIGASITPTYLPAAPEPVPNLLPKTHMTGTHRPTAPAPRPTLPGHLSAPPSTQTPSAPTPSATTAAIAEPAPEAPDPTPSKSATNPPLPDSSPSPSDLEQSAPSIPSPHSSGSTIPDELQAAEDWLRRTTNGHGVDLLRPDASVSVNNPSPPADRFTGSS